MLKETCTREKSPSLTPTPNPHHPGADPVFDAPPSCSRTRSRLSLAILLCTGLSLAQIAAAADLTLEELARRMDALAAENAHLKQRIEQLEGQASQTVAQQEAPKSQRERDGLSGVVGFEHDYAYAILDPTTNRNRKQKLQLEARRDGTLKDNSIILSGAVTALADIQNSNRDDKFGYLMRHPTASNHRGEWVSEAIIHSGQLAATATLGDWTTAYAELLYDPSQSFGPGTLVDVQRNQVELRRGYVMFGNLDKSPLYLAIGKMDIPFGLMDTPNPFTASTVWHAFGGLAYGARGGYSKDGWNINLMGVQGGAQFRAANVEVNNSTTPSQLNNFALDASHTFAFSNDSSLLLGASYLHGSGYCHGFPITHFSACNDRNGAFDLYAQFNSDKWMLQAEVARTEDVWPGTFNPAIPQFKASKVTSFDIGGKYRTVMFDTKVDLSADFSSFIAGPDGAPWERQDQLVFGVAGHLTPSVKLFGEVIHVRGYAPLNFLSGGNPNLPAGQTDADADARTTALLLGVNAAF